MTEAPGIYRVGTDAETCPFCDIVEPRIIWSAPLAMAIRDGFPVSPGHSIVIPRRHVASWAELTNDEKAAIVTGIDAARSQLSIERHPDGFNVGFNDGPAAGQTVMHFHVHVIPRYVGDVPDPRGGVRWVLPENAAYWQDSDE